MLLTSAIIFGFIVIFMLVSGLIVLWHRGSEDLDAWGLFIARVLHGDRPSTQEPPLNHEDYHRQPGLPRPEDSASQYQTRDQRPQITPDEARRPQTK